MRLVEKCWDELSGEACVFLIVVAMLCLTLLVGVTLLVICQVLVTAGI